MAAQAKNVLFVCAGDPARSLMAEAILNRIGGAGFRAFSATVNGPASATSTVTDLLKSNRLPALNHAPARLEEFCNDGATSMDFVIVLQPPLAEEVIARIPGHPQKANWRISDPGTANGDPIAATAALRKSFLELENRIKLFVLVQHDGRTRKLAA